MSRTGRAPIPTKSPTMHIEHHVWYSPRLGHDMGVAVFGHWGPPLLAFPTSHGDEWELHRHGLIDAVGEFIEAGPREDLLRRLQQPRVVPEQGRAPVPSQLAAAHVRRVHPRGGLAVHLRRHAVARHRDCDDGRLAGRVPCGEHAVPLSRTRSSAATRSPGSTICAHFMGGMYDDNFYFHNPVDYLANLHDPWVIRAARVAARSGW